MASQASNFIVGKPKGDIIMKSNRFLLQITGCMLPESTINEWDLPVLAINFRIKWEVLLQTVVKDNKSILLT